MDLGITKDVAESTVLHHSVYNNFPRDNHRGSIGNLGIYVVRRILPTGTKE